MIQWAPVFHFYQPPSQDPVITTQVLHSSYIPFLNELKRHPELKLTFNISGSLILQLEELNRSDFFEIIHELVDRNQVEFVNSPLYHPLIPLHDIQIALRQLEYNADIISHFLHKSPMSVIFPPELAVNQSSIDSLSRAASSILVDESAIYGEHSNEKVPPQTLHKYKNVKLIASSRAVTDIIRSYPVQLNPNKFADWLLSQESHNDKIVSVNDIEAFGHHYEERLDFLYHVHKDKRVDIKPLSGLLGSTARNLPNIEYVHESSWMFQKDNINAFELWQNSANPLQQRYWELIRTAELHLKNTPPPEQDIDLIFSSSQKHFDRGISSCHLYWLSNWPWWNPKISEAGAIELISAVRGLPISNKEKLKAEKQYLSFIDELWQYHWSEKPEKRYREYEKFRRTQLASLPSL